MLVGDWLDYHGYFWRWWLASVLVVIGLGMVNIRILQMVHPIVKWVIMGGGY